MFQQQSLYGIVLLNSLTLLLCANAANETNSFSIGDRILLDQEFDNSNDNSNAVVENAQFVWHTILEDAETGQLLCGGSLIASVWVLTAAHCLSKRDEIVVVFSSSIVIQYDTDILTSTNLYMHPAYETPRSSNDIGLIKLPRPPNQLRRIHPVELPTWSQINETFQGFTATAMGFGYTSDKPPYNLPPFLYTMNGTVLGNAECSKDYARTIPETDLCIMGVRKETICNGDSGGSLVVRKEDGKYMQIGIAAYGYSKECGLPKPSGFARVTKFLGWIEAVIGEGVVKG